MTIYDTRNRAQCAGPFSRYLPVHPGAKLGAIQPIQTNSNHFQPLMDVTYIYLDSLAVRVSYVKLRLLWVVTRRALSQ
jgi:hypothetical protein